MHAEADQYVLPISRVEPGVIISATRERLDDAIQIVQVAQEGAAFEVRAIPSHWLSHALDGPLTARILHIVHHDEKAGSKPFLVDAHIDPFTVGFSHLPETICPIEGIVLGVKALVESIQAVPLRCFLKKVFQRRDVFQHFWTMPASAKHHHAGPGGLSVHSLEVARDLASHGGLSDVELDLGIAGALLHDIGKVWSYTSDMFPNAAGLAMGHELVGLSRLEPELLTLEEAWPDGAYVMRCLLSGHSRVRGNGSLPTSLLPRIKACDQRSCEQDRAGNHKRNSYCPAWTPQPWQP